MNEQKVGLDTSEQDLFAVELPDAVVEAAACAGGGPTPAFTVAMCTGNVECPF